MLVRLMAATAVSALLAGAAVAQTAPMTAPMQDTGTPAGAMQAPMTETGAMQAPMTEPMTPMPADAMAKPMPADAMASDTASTMPMPMDSTMAQPMGAMQMTASRPVADTPENRARYRPLSNAGRRSRAAAN